jgi:hypothetical protein
MKEEDKKGVVAVVNTINSDIMSNVPRYYSGLRLEEVGGGYSITYLGLLLWIEGYDGYKGEVELHVFLRNAMHEVINELNRLVIRQHPELTEG